ncbi:hypothetical protein KAX02_02860 [candidate division WOR-3 bacterium]|nr:hypothetical protein [candidate division WOR-3 bacterium]
MKKVTPRKKLDRQCLKIWADIVKLKQCCDITGEQQSSLSSIVFHAHHIVSRRYTAGRYSLDNGLCLTQGSHFWEKVDPEKFRDMVISAIGENKFNELKEKYMKTCKISEEKLQIIHTGLKLEYKKRLQEQD